MNIEDPDKERKSGEDAKLKKIGLNIRFKRVTFPDRSCYT